VRSYFHLNTAVARVITALRKQFKSVPDPHRTRHETTSLLYPKIADASAITAGVGNNTCSLQTASLISTHQNTLVEALVPGAPAVFFRNIWIAHCTNNIQAGKSICAVHWRACKNVGDIGDLPLCTWLFTPAIVKRPVSIGYAQVDLTSPLCRRGIYPAPNSLRGIWKLVSLCSKTLNEEQY